MGQRVNELVSSLVISAWHPSIDAMNGQNLLTDQRWVFFTFVFLLVSSAAITCSAKKPAERVSDSARTPIFSYLPSGYDKKLTGGLNAGNIEADLRFFTKYPHVAGSQRNNELARYISDEWTKLGFDKVEMPSYNVTLSLPRSHKSSKVQILDQKGNIIFQAAQNEKPLQATESQPGILQSYLAFSPSGTVQGDVVYANYGREEDFELLANMGVSVRGNIVLLRMGRMFRGNKVQLAEKRGAIGTLLYTDPREFAPEGSGSTFPDSFWLPDTGIQRGVAIYRGVPGDPRTPGMPSIDGIYRMNDTFMPSVPSYQLSYADALDVLRLMNGAKVPDDWKGNLPVTYRTGPGFRNSTLRLKIVVHNKLQTRPIFNVIGTILGSQEPDRYVLMGNHRDAWVFGAADPSSGTSILMEVSRGLGRLLKAGWRPRRTIKLCSWDAEEFILMGSTEWTEENAKVLSQRAVAYLNMDVAVGGNWSFNVDGSPLMHDLLISATKQVSDPTAPNRTLYEVMAERDLAKSKMGQPKCNNLAFGSDYAGFIHYLGITSADWSYIFGGKHNIRRSYPVYHSIHDSFYWMKTFVDPGFKIHLAVARYAGLVLMNVADKPLLPFNTKTLADTISGYLDTFKSSAYVKRHNIDLTFLLNAVTKFKKASERFENVRDKLNDDKDFGKLRVLNDQLLQLERAFVQEADQYSGASFRHVIYGPDFRNFYSGKYFPRIQRAIATAGETGHEDVKRQVSLITYAILSAVKVLEPVF